MVDGYTYAREGHPNADILASKIDSLEGIASDGDAPGGIVTSSGMGAISAMFLGLLKQGDQVLAEWILMVPALNPAPASTPPRP